MTKKRQSPPAYVVRQVSVEELEGTLNEMIASGLLIKHVLCGNNILFTVIALEPAL